MTEYRLKQELLDYGWLPAKDAPKGIRFRVAHVLDPSSFKKDAFCLANGEKDETDEWCCNVGFICVDGMLRFQPTHYLPTDEDRIVAHVEKAGLTRTDIIAARLQLSTAKTRTILKRLERQGRVRRSDRYSAVNSIAWTMPKSGDAA